MINASLHFRQNTDLQENSRFYFFLINLKSTPDFIL